MIEAFQFIGWLSPLRFAFWHIWAQALVLKPCLPILLGWFPLLVRPQLSLYSSMQEVYSLLLLVIYNDVSLDFYKCLPFLHLTHTRNDLRYSTEEYYKRGGFLGASLRDICLASSWRLYGDMTSWCDVSTSTAVVPSVVEKRPLDDILGKMILGAHASSVIPLEGSSESFHITMSGKLVRQRPRFTLSASRAGDDKSPVNCSFLAWSTFVVLPKKRPLVDIASSVLQDSCASACDWVCLHDENHSKLQASNTLANLKLEIPVQGSGEDIKRRRAGKDVSGYRGRSFTP